MWVKMRDDNSQEKIQEVMQLLYRFTCSIDYYLEIKFISSDKACIVKYQNSDKNYCSVCI